MILPNSNSKSWCRTIELCTVKKEISFPISSQTMSTPKQLEVLTAARCECRLACLHWYDKVVVPKAKNITTEHQRLWETFGASGEPIAIFNARAVFNGLHDYRSCRVLVIRRIGCICKSPYDVCLLWREGKLLEHEWYRASAFCKRRSIGFLCSKLSQCCSDIASAPPAPDEDESDSGDDTSTFGLPMPTCVSCNTEGPEFAIEQCHCLTRCIECALRSRVCPTCGRALYRLPRNYHT